jgi:hypothetical protein
LIKDEDIVKRILKIALRYMGFDDKQISIKCGRTRGIDIEARNEDLGHLIIEVKPEGKTDQQTGNYFLNGLAELLQRMDSPDKTYFLALPAHRRYVNLIKRLPLWIKQQLQLHFLLIKMNEDGSYSIAMLCPPINRV